MTKLSQKQYDESFVKKILGFYIFFQIYMIIVRLVRFGAVYINGQHSLALMFDFYDIVYYAINYDEGFIIRGLAGTLFGDALLGMKLDILVWSNILKLVYSIIFVGILTFCLFRLQGDKLKVLCAIMFIRPLYICNATLYTLKPDIFWYASLVPIVFLLWSDKSKYFNIKMIGVVLLSILAMLFHQAFIFIFAPLVCMFLIDKKDKGWFIGYGFILCTVFVLMLKFGQADYDMLYQKVANRLVEADLWTIMNESGAMPLTDVGPLPGLYYEYGTSRVDQLFQSQQIMDVYFKYHVPVCFINLLLCIPSLLITYKTVKEYCAKVLVKSSLVQLLTCVMVLPFIVLLFFTIDVDRWALMTLTSFNIFSLYVTHKHDLDVKYEANKILVISMIALVLSYPLLVLVGFV